MNAVNQPDFVANYKRIKALPWQRKGPLSDPAPNQPAAPKHPAIARHRDMILAAPSKGVTLYAWPIGPHQWGRDVLHVVTVKAGFREILAQVCQKYGVSPLDVKSARRTADLTLPRFEVCYRIKTETGMSLPQIGRLMGRDHTSVLHGIRRYTKMLAEGLVEL